MILNVEKIKIINVYVIIKIINVFQQITLVYVWLMLINAKFKIKQNMYVLVINKTM